MKKQLSSLNPPFFYTKLRIVMKCVMHAKSPVKASFIICNYGDET